MALDKAAVPLLPQLCTQRNMSNATKLVCKASPILAAMKSVKQSK
jgi:hypothetical protein